MDKVKSKVPKLRFPEFSDDWKVQRLEMLFDEFKSGNSITSKDIDALGNYPVYGGNGLRGYTDSYTHDGFYLLVGRQGALCGNINRAYGKSYISEHAIAGKANETSDTEWLAQKLDYLKLNRLSESSAQPGLAVNKLLRLKLVVPSKAEQQKIASFLTAVDDKIQQLTKKKELLEKYKKGVMQKIFSQEIRFKLLLSEAEVDDDGIDYPDWEKKRLDELSIKKSSSISANTLEENSGEYIIYGASGVLKKINYYTEEKAYISIVKDGAGVGRILLCAPKTSVLGTLDIVKPRDNVNLYFLYLVLSRIKMKKFITGSTIPHIYYKDYSTEKVSCPEMDEQQKIADFLSSVDKKIDSVNTQLEKTKEFKKGLLQQMFV